MSDLKSKSLAELHELAGKAGIEKFRLLRRDELIEKLDQGEGSDSDWSGSDSQGKGSGSRRRRGNRGRRGDRERRSDRERRNGRDRDEEKEEKGGRDSEGDDSEAEPELTEITGVLDVLPGAAASSAPRMVPRPGSTYRRPRSVVASCAPETR